MAMKKRFLGLAMAAAIVIPATTVYAAGNQTVQFDATGEYNHKVNVSGIVKTLDGQIPAGKLEVELPTAMSFMVDEEGNFHGSEFTVTNKSQAGIDVFVEHFQDGNGNITVKPKNKIKADAGKDTLDRSNVYLELNGNVGAEKKKIDLAELNSMQSDDVSRKILNVSGESLGLITLTGGAGQGEGKGNLDDEGASDNFTLLFKIKKEK